MMFLTPLQIALILIVVVTFIMYIKWVRSKYPPGPWPLPIIGNVHLLSKKPYIELTNMGRIYGPVMTVWMTWIPTIIVSDLHLMKEALVKKGVDFAGRGMDTVGFKIIFYDNEDLSSRSYDDKLLTLRKLSLSIMKSKAIGGFSIQKVVEEEIHHLLKLLQNANGRLIDPSPFLHLPVCNIVMRTILNIRFENEEDPEFLKWKKAMLSLTYATETSILISIVPVLAHIIPGIQSKIRSHMRLFDDNVKEHIESHEETYQEGVIRDLTDIIIQYRRNQSNNTLASQKLTRVNMYGLVQNMIIGGTQTTLATIRWAFLALLHRKDIQEKLRLELDQYLKKRREDTLRGKSNIDEYDDHQSSQLPFTLADKPHLPYLNAFIHETLRLWPVSPLAIPHKTMVDTSIGNYSIPQNTPVVFNIFACHKDDAVWEKPFDFIPERFLDSNGLFDNTKAKQLLTFGAGPRSCVAENLAKMEIFICLANVLHRFELCCSSVDALPALSDGDFRFELAPHHYEMVFKMRPLP